MWSCDPSAAHLVDLAGHRERLEDFGLTSVAAGRARPERVTADTVIVDIGREIAHWTRKWPAGRAAVDKVAVSCPVGSGHIPAQKTQNVASTPWVTADVCLAPSTWDYPFDFQGVRARERHHVTATAVPPAESKTTYLNT